MDSEKIISASAWHARASYLHAVEWYLDQMTLFINPTKLIIIIFFSNNQFLIIFEKLILVK